MKRFFATLIALALAILPAHGDMLLTGIGNGNGSTPPTPVSMAFNQNQNGCASVTTCTYAAQAIGTASATRSVILGFATFGTTPTSVTIGGIAATQLATTSNGGTVNYYFYGAAVPTGTTASYVINTAATTGTAGVTVSSWSVYDLLSLTPINTQIDNVNAPGVITGLTTLNGGVALLYSERGAASAPAITLSGSFTQDYNALGLLTTLRFAGGSVLTTGANLSATATYDANAGTQRVIMGISLR